MITKEDLIHADTINEDIQYLRKVVFKHNTRMASDFETLLNLAINIVIADSYTSELKNAVDELESFLR